MKDFRRMNVRTSCWTTSRIERRTDRGKDECTYELLDDVLDHLTDERRMDREKDECMFELLDDVLDHLADRERDR